MTTIQRFLTSWVATSALPRMILRAEGSPRVAYSSDYEQEFRRADAGTGTWQKPWVNDHSYSNFWKHSVGDDYRHKSGWRAWDAQVPLRHSNAITAQTGVPGITVTVDRLLYPTGVGVVITALYEGDPISELQAKRIPHALEEEPIFRTRSGEGPGVPLRRFVADLLTDLQREVLGDVDPDATTDDRPTKITTITRTIEPALLKDGATAPETDRTAAVAFLMGLCGIEGSTAVAAGRKLGQTTAWADTLRVRGRGAQATWSPVLSGNKRGSKLLSCYHRNQVFAALQLGSLLNAVSAVAESGVGSAPELSRELIRTRLLLLGRIYGGAKNAYISEFSYRTIKESDLVETINELRDELGTKHEPLWAPLDSST